jgi:pyruvate dehydrogenase E1 component alpha subunit
VAVLSVTRRARATASAGEGGTLIEAVTAPPGEGEGRDAWSKRDPIGRMRRYLEARALWSAEREQRLWAEARSDVDRALTEAEREGPPAPHTMFDDVYAQMPWHLREQRAGLRVGSASAAEPRRAQDGDRT